MLCVCHTTPIQKLLCLHVCRQAGPTQRVDCLAPRWETALSVFPKDLSSQVSFFLSNDAFDKYLQYVIRTVIRYIHGDKNLPFQTRG